MNGKLEFIDDEGEIARDILQDLGLAFGSNGKQERRRKAVRREIERDDSISDAF